MRFADPEALARAAFDAYLAGDSLALREMTHPDAAREYYDLALECLAGWLRLHHISEVPGSGAPSGGAARSFPSDASVEDLPLHHLRGVRVFRDIALLEPQDFLERAFAGGAELFGHPSRPDDRWQTLQRFEVTGVRREDDLARVAYRHTQQDPDGSISTNDEELVARFYDGGWCLWFAHLLFTPLMLFLDQ